MSDIILTAKEQEKLNIINATREKKITNGQAAKMLGISIRQIKRLKKSIRAHGETAVIHRLRGKPSNHHIAQNIKDKTFIGSKT